MKISLFLVIFGGFTSIYFIGKMLVRLVRGPKPSSSKDTIIFPDDYYESLNYFRVDNSKVYAVKKDNTEDEVFNSGPMAAQEYLTKVQAGFDEWIRNQKFKKAASPKEPSNSKITFPS